jgi:hypothetical protein
MYTSYQQQQQFSPRLGRLAAAVFVLLIAASLVLSACTPGQATQAPASGTQIPASGGGLVTKDKAPFALAAKKALAEKLGIDASQVTFVSADSTQWPDKCLGVIVMGQMCAQGVTPGYLVKFKVGDVMHEVHTDELGESVRIKE